MGLYTLLLKIRGKKFLSFYSSLSPRYISPKRNYIEKNNKTLKTKRSCPGGRVLDCVFCFYALGRVWVKQAAGGVCVWLGCALCAGWPPRPNASPSV